MQYSLIFAERFESLSCLAVSKRILETRPQPGVAEDDALAICAELSSSGSACAAGSIVAPGA